MRQIIEFKQASRQADAERLFARLDEVSWIILERLDQAREQVESAA